MGFFSELYRQYQECLEFGCDPYEGIEMPDIPDPNEISCSCGARFVPARKHWKLCSNCARRKFQNRTYRKHGFEPGPGDGGILYRYGSPVMIDDGNGNIWTEDDDDYDDFY